MSNTITYTIDKFAVFNELNGNQNVIYRIYFTALGVNDDDESIRYSSKENIRLQAPNENDEFIDVNDITFEKCMQWIEENGVKENVEQRINSKINETINPTKSMINPNF